MKGKKMPDGTDTSRKAVERMASAIERHQNRKRQKHKHNLNYAAPDSRYEGIPNTLRALLARAEAAEAELHHERARVLSLESEVAALRETHRADIAAGADLETKLAAAREALEAIERGDDSADGMQRDIARAALRALAGEKGDG